MQDHCVSTSMQFFDNNCLSHQIKNCAFAYASASQKENNCASHDCSASHHCRLVSNLFEIRHAKHLWFSHAKKLSFTHHASPLLNWRRPETCKTKTKTKTVPPATHISSRKSCIMQVKTKTFVWFWLFHATCKKKRTCSGVLSSSTNCGQNGLCQFFAIHTGCCPVDIIHPCMLFTLAPTKTPCEQIAKNQLTHYKR